MFLEDILGRLSAPVATETFTYRF